MGTPKVVFEGTYIGRTSFRVVQVGDSLRDIGDIVVEKATGLNAMHELKWEEVPTTWDELVLVLLLVQHIRSFSSTVPVPLLTKEPQPHPQSGYQVCGACEDAGDVAEELSPAEQKEEEDIPF